MSLPVSQLASFGAIKEVTFASSPGAPTLFARGTVTVNPKRNLLMLDDVGARPGQSFPGSGAYIGSLTMEVTAQPEAINAFLAWAWGSQSVPALETSPSSTLAYSSTVSYGSLQMLPSFTLQVARNDGKGVNYLGCTIDSVSLSGGPNGLLKAQFNVVYADESVTNSPTVASFLTTLPYNNTFTGSTLTYASAALSGVVRSIKFTLNNNLLKNQFDLGSIKVKAFPLGVRKASGSLQSTYGSIAEYERFYGAAAATSPQPTITGVGISWAIASPSAIDSNYNPTLTLNAPNCALESVSLPLAPAGGAIEITQNFQCFETAGSGNDTTLSLVAASSAAY